MCVITPCCVRHNTVLCLSQHRVVSVTTPCCVCHNTVLCLSQHRGVVSVTTLCCVCHNTVLCLSQHRGVVSVTTLCCVCQNTVLCQTQHRVVSVTHLVCCAVTTDQVQSPTNTSSNTHHTIPSSLLQIHISLLSRAVTSTINTTLFLSHERKKVQTVCV